MTGLLFLLGCHAALDSSRPPFDFSTCLAGWTRTAADSIVAEQQLTAATPWTEPPAFILANPIQADWAPATHTVAWLMGRPIFWFSADQSALYVDDEAFETLTPVDLTTLPTGRTVSIGQALPSTRVALGDRDIIELLIQADVLRVYDQEGGRVCLVGEIREGGTWTGHLVGEHDLDRGPLDFRVDIDGGGHITVTGG